jgi:bifunctional non-homologous end joining protein LigD
MSSEKGGTVARRANINVLAMGLLQTYRTKRHFDVTPEPRGKASRRGGNSFVIQKHAARRLHYDLRLEMDGVMKSWAITRGPSLEPGEKRLAVHVEDHPIEYNKFEGTIPEGQYGGGTVMIWDRGRWEPAGDPHEGYKKGHLSFRLDGKRLQGLWHLVRMRERPGEKRENWLFIKAHDEGARSASDPNILEEDFSVASGRSMQEIAAAKGAVWHSNKSVKENTRRLAEAAAKPRQVQQAGKTKTTRAATRARKTKGSAKATKRGKPEDDADPVPGARRAPLPDFIRPCLALLGDKAPEDADWIHEIKFDGYRIQTRIDRGESKLLTRQALDWSAKFATIAEAVASLPVEQAIIDGEIIAEDEAGLPSFSALQQGLREGRTGNFVYYVFDLLYLDGYDLMPAALEARKEALARLVARLSHEAPIRLSENFTESGGALLKHACRMKLEGIISKRRSGPYRPGRGGDWIKTKCSDRQEFVVAGYAPSEVDPRSIGALILAYYDDGRLRYAGRVGSGYTHKMARSLWTRLQPLRTETPPFGATPKEETRARNARWVEPHEVVEVDFRGWTHGDRVRQASFQGIREDKRPTEIVRETKTAAGPKKSKIAAAGSRLNLSKKAGGIPEGDNLPFKLTNPDRVYWNDVGITKQDLAEYYTRIWKWMAPHVVGRVLALVRCPGGATAECFFQKHASAGIDKTRLHLVAEPDGDQTISIDDINGLIALVQAGVLEIHSRGTTIDHLEEADRLVFDLDPGPGIDWKGLVAAAREVGQRLAGFGLTSFLKTSGGKGLHVVLPIRYTPWEQAKDFCRSLAEQMTADAPNRYTATVKKSARGNRIFIDYLRNSREATAVAPFSTRIRPGAPVSTPIAWEELGSLGSSDRYTILNLPQRLARLRTDPWKDIGRLKQALPAGRRRRR